MPSLRVWLDRWLALADVQGGEPLFRPIDRLQRILPARLAGDPVAKIVRRRVQGSSETLAVQVANAVSRMRGSDVQKPPGIAESIDWLAALSLLGVERLDVAAIDRTLGSVLKYGEDQEVIRAAGLEQLVPGGD